MKRQRSMQARGRMIGWVGGAAGGIGVVALAASILMPWAQSGEVATIARNHNRTFADEAGYTATIGEYLVAEAVVLDTVADRSVTYDVARQPAPVVDCRTVLGSAIAVCAPAEEATREPQVMSQLYGPR